MRGASTRSEAALWKMLRKLEGLHFRRQAPFGPYVVDFVSHRARLVVEVDGGIYDLAAVKARDERRDGWLTARGYRVLRVSDYGVVNEPASTIAVILANIGETPPPPTPSPHGGGDF